MEQVRIVMERRRSSKTAGAKFGGEKGGGGPRYMLPRGTTIPTTGLLWCTLFAWNAGTALHRRSSNTGSLESVLWGLLKQQHNNAGQYASWAAQLGPVTLKQTWLKPQSIASH